MKGTKVFILAALLIILIGAGMKIFGGYATSPVGGSKTSGRIVASLTGTQVISIGLIMLFLLVMTWLYKQKNQMINI
jgi:hypothetical protein